MKSNESSATPLVQESESAHLDWIDILRVVSIFLVVCCHCCDPFNLSSDNNPDFGFFGALYGSMLRPCVPLFAMMTGLLVLPIKQASVSSFYRKRLVRIVIPMFVFSILYNIFPWLVGLLGGGESLVVTFFPYSGAYGEHPSLEFVDMIKNIAISPFHFSVYDVHLWYLYMLVGLYLFMPILSTWLSHCTKRDIEIFLFLWLVSLFFPYVTNYVSQYFWGTCSWNSFGMLYYFAGFNGYLLLGYYLRHYNKLSLTSSLMIGIPMFAIGFAVTFMGFRHITADPNSSEQMIELFWTYCTPNVVAMTVPVFILAQKIKWRCGCLKTVARYGLGIYLSHYFFVGLGYGLIDTLGLPIFLRIPMAAILVFAFSALLTVGLYKLAPKVAKYVMG